MKYLNKKRFNLGFTIVEILIASTIISLTSIALMSAATKGIELSGRALKQTQANFLLEEGAEATRTIRDNNWTNISDLTLDTNYYLTFDNNLNTWSLGTTPVALVDSTFTRTIVFSAVNRDGNDSIATSGTLDAGTKKVSIIVSWNAKGEILSKNLAFYISNIF